MALLENSTIRLVTAAGILVGVASIVYTATAFKTNIERDIGDIKKSVMSLASNIEAVNSKVVGKTPEGWHRRDMFEWCNATEKDNGGFNCADPYGLPGYKHWSATQNSTLKGGNK